MGDAISSRILTLEAKGNIEKNLGKVQAKFGDVKKDVKDSSK
jgi:uncharacterized protein YjbJ (UPF0337 family)